MDSLRPKRNFTILATKNETMTENEISKIVVEEAIYIHKSIGPGMLEICLCSLPS